MDGLTALAEALDSASDLISGDGSQDSGPRQPSTSILQLVALGPHGVGKSAVLNSLLGHPVLPVEKGGATKCPVVVQVTRDASRVKGYLSSRPKEELKSAAEIRTALAGEGKRWLPNLTRSSDALVLDLYSSSAPGLKLVDLPGFDKRLPDQAADYGKGDALILVLLAAPAAPGVANARVLLAAQELDPEGKRTIGVLTFVDEARGDGRALAAVSKLLAGQGPQLTKDIPWVALLGAPGGEENMEGQWAAEARVLQSTLPGAPRERLGRDGLLAMLARMIKARLKDKIPRVLAGLEGRSAEVELELVRLGAQMMQTAEGTRALALQLCREFDTALIHHLEAGEVGGAKMVALFETGLPQRIRRLPLKDIFRLENLKKTVSEADGYLPYLLSPERGVRALVKLALDLAKQPAAQCVDEVHRVLLELVSAAASSTPGLGRFPPLKRELVEIASAALEDYRKEAKAMVAALIDMERSFIPPSHFRRLAQRRLERLRFEEERGSRSGRRIPEGDTKDGASDSPREEGRLARAMNSVRSLGGSTPPKEAAGPTYVDGQEVMAGYLLKKGSGSSKWQKRWFVVNERTGKLGYVKKPEEKSFRGVMQLQDASVVELSEVEGGAEAGSSAKGPLRPSSSGLREDALRSSQTEADLILRISHKQSYTTLVKSHYSLFLKADNMAEKFRWLAKLRAAGRAPREGAENGEGSVASSRPLPTPAPSSASSSTPSTPSRDVAPVSSRAGPSDPDADLMLIAAEVKDYVDAVLDSLVANIPKAVVLCQVDKTRLEMLAKLYQSVSVLPDGRIEELVQEDATVRLQRERARQQAERLQKLQRQLSMQQDVAADIPEPDAGPSQSGSSRPSPVVEDWRLAFQSAGDADEDFTNVESTSRRSSDSSVRDGDIVENGSTTPKRANPVRRPPPPPGVQYNNR